MKWWSKIRGQRSDEEEVSPSGAPVFRYETKNLVQAFDDLGESSLDAIDAHIMKYVGKPDTVLHELVSPTVHVDIHLIPPTQTNNFITLVTSGMSDKPMSAAPRPDLQFAELVIALPSEWPLNETSIKDENNYWPIRMMKFLARFPHEYSTWLWEGHTITNGDPATPFADNTSMDCVLLSSPLLFDKAFRKLSVRPDKTIHFLSLIPIHPEESKHKLEHGLDSLYEHFDRAKVSELLDPARPSCI